MSQYQQYKSTDANHDIVESDNDECDMLNDDIENQLNASTQGMINDDGELKI